MVDSEFESRVLGEYPITDYKFFDTSLLMFSDNIRYICKTECQMYDKSYSCPSAVGTKEECEARCLEYKNGFIFSSIAIVNDSANLEETLSTKPEHEKMTREIKAMFEERFGKCLALSADACSICEKCAYPNEPCRHPDIMLPCIESHTIVVTDIAEKLGMEFFMGADMVTWFSIILFNEK